MNVANGPDMMMKGCLRSMLQMKLVRVRRVLSCGRHLILLKKAISARIQARHLRSRPVRCSKVGGSGLDK